MKNKTRLGLLAVVGLGIMTSQLDVDSFFFNCQSTYNRLRLYINQLPDISVDFDNDFDMDIKKTKLVNPFTGKFRDSYRENMGNGEFRDRPDLDVEYSLRL
jgi:hypothetical protein